MTLNCTRTPVGPGNVQCTNTFTYDMSHSCDRPRANDVTRVGSNDAQHDPWQCRGHVAALQQKSHHCTFLQSSFPKWEQLQSASTGNISVSNFIPVRRTCNWSIWWITEVFPYLNTLYMSAWVRSVAWLWPAVMTSCTGAAAVFSPHLKKLGLPLLCFVKLQSLKFPQWEPKTISPSTFQDKHHVLGLKVDIISYRRKFTRKADFFPSASPVTRATSDTCNSTLNLPNTLCRHNNHNKKK